MSDVFISYSRSDRDFVLKLFKVLESGGDDAWVDWEDIEYAEDWWTKICAGIEQADNFVFIITPDSVRSKVCFDEIEHAVKNNKRIVPVLHRKISDRADEQRMHPAISKHNWLPFTNDDSLEKSLPDLLETIHKDPDHVQTHTRLLVRAHEWLNNEKKPSLLLRGDDLKAAESWLTTGVNKGPVPTSLHADYIAASRAGQRKFQRNLLIAALSAVVVSLALAILAGLSTVRANTNLSISQTNEARALLAEADAEYRVDYANSVSLSLHASDVYANGDSFLAMALAVEANSINSPPPEAYRALFELGYSAPGAYREFDGDMGFVESMAIAPDVSSVAASGCVDSINLDCTVYETMLWDVESGQRPIVLQGFPQPVTAMAYSPDSDELITAACVERVELTCVRSEIIRWHVSTGSRLIQVGSVEGVISSLLYTPEDDTLFAAVCQASDCSEGEIIQFDITAGAEDRRFGSLSGWVGKMILSPDATELASLTCDGEANAIFCYDVRIQTWELASGLVDIDLALEEANADIWYTFSGQLISVGFNLTQGSLIQRNLITLEPLSTIPLEQYLDPWTIIRMSPGGQRIWLTLCTQTGSAGGCYGTSELILYDIVNEAELGRYGPISGSVIHMVFSADGRFALTDNSDRKLQIWDTFGGTYQPGIIVKGEISDVSVSPDSSVALISSCTGDDCQAIVWDITTSGVSSQFSLPGRAQKSQVLDNGERARFLVDTQPPLSSYEIDTLFEWNIMEGAQIQRSEIASANAEKPLLPSDGQLPLAVSVQSNSFLDIREINSGELISQIPVPSRDNSYLNLIWAEPILENHILYAICDNAAVDGCYGTVNLGLYDIQKDSPVWTNTTLRQTDGAIQVVLFGNSLDGSHFMTGICDDPVRGRCNADRQVIVWDTLTGAMVQELGGIFLRDKISRTPAYATSGELIENGKLALISFGASIQSPHLTLLWNVDNGAILGEFLAPATIRTVAPDGRSVLTVQCIERDEHGSCTTSYVGVIDIGVPDEWVQWAVENRVLRDFTCEQRRTYNLLPPCDE